MPGGRGGLSGLCQRLCDPTGYGVRPPFDGGGLRPALSDSGGGSDSHPGQDRRDPGPGGRDLRQCVGDPVPHRRGLRQGGQNRRPAHGPAHLRRPSGGGGPGRADGQSGREAGHGDRQRGDGPARGLSSAGCRMRGDGNATLLPPRGDRGARRVRGGLL